MSLKITSNARRVASSMKKQINSMIREGSRASSVVSYDTPYAVYVHEDLTPKTFSKAGTGPKFLEEPARQLASSGLLAAEFASAMRRGAGLKASVRQCALAVLEASLAVCPVDTTELYKSGKVRDDQATGFNLET